MKEFTITMTSKGQFTMPAEVRKVLEVSETSNKLKLVLDPRTKQARIESPTSFDDIRQKTAKFISPEIPPLLDPRALYETRKPKI